MQPAIDTYGSCTCTWSLSINQRLWTVRAHGPYHQATLKCSRSNHNYNQRQRHLANVFKGFIDGSIAAKLQNRLDSSVATSIHDDVLAKVHARTY